MRRFAPLPALVVALGLLNPAPAKAGMYDQIVDSMTYIWSVIAGAADTASTAVTPPTPMSTLKHMRGEDKGEFWQMLEDAGYDLKSIDTEVGLIPGVEAVYIYKRELSDADREALEEKLEKHSHGHSGLIARLERAIIYALLDASELGDYRVEHLKVTFLPLPAASFTLIPTSEVMEMEHDKIFRAVKEQHRELRQFRRDFNQARSQPQ